MSKPWPKKLSKKDPDPSDYNDLSVETQRLVVHGDHVYFFIWCWDMDESDNQISVLFRVHKSFDAPGERLAAIKTEMVDLCLHDGQLVALENGQADDGAFGVVHRLAPGAGAPVSSTRLEQGTVWKALGVGAKNTLFAAGNVVQRFDGTKWHATELPEGALIKAIASNGTTTLGVGEPALVVGLDPDGDARVVSRATDEYGIPQYAGIDIADDGTVSIASNDGDDCRQGLLEKLEPIETPDRGVYNDSCLFQGKRYWSAAGDYGVGGVYVQNGKKLELVFQEQGCFLFTPTEDYLFIASEAGILRYDGKEEWKPVSTNYDEDEEVWVMLPGEPEAADDEDEDEDDEEEGDE